MATMGWRSCLCPWRERARCCPCSRPGGQPSGYLFAEAPGGGWYVKTCTPDELVFLLVGPCAGVEWVALDPRPGPRREGEAATVMPRENFVDYLLGLTRPLMASRKRLRDYRR